MLSEGVPFLPPESQQHDEGEHRASILEAVILLILIALLLVIAAVMQLF
jgi:hypothetical protein